MLKQISERYDEEKHEIMVADGFNAAIIGIEEKTMRLIYSVKKCKKVLMKRDGMNYEEATEFFEFNVSGAYHGEKTPI